MNPLSCSFAALSVAHTLLHSSSHHFSLPLLFPPLSPFSPLLPSLLPLQNSTSQKSSQSNLQATPLLHRLSAAHAYITTFVHVCRVGQTEIRTLSLSHWGSELGISLLHSISKLYNSLVWESTILLALCAGDDAHFSDEAPTYFGKADLDLLLSAVTAAQSSTGLVGVLAHAPSNLSTANVSPSNHANVDADEQPMEVDEASRASAPPTSLPATLAPPSAMPQALIVASASPTSGRF